MESETGSRLRQAVLERIRLTARRAKLTPAQIFVQSNRIILNPLRSYLNDGRQVIGCLQRSRPRDVA